MRKSPPAFQADESFFSFTTRRPVAILMVVLAVAVFGYVSYNRLARTLMPNMTYPTLTVRTTYPGTAPEEIETIVSRPLEQQLGIIPKLVSIRSISKAGQSDVILEFQWKTDMDAVAQEVREKVDRFRLPEGAQRPLLLHYDPSLDPILRIGLAGEQSLYELRHLAEFEVKRKLETIPGVAAIKVKGGLEEEFLVAIDESKLASLKLDITQIGQRLQQGNVNMPGGNLREGQTEYLIRTLNEFRTLDEIGQLVVTRQGSVDIRLRDIATIQRFHKDREIITRMNGRESVEIEIYKEADANVITVANRVKAAIFGNDEQQKYVAGLGKAAGAKPAAPPPETAKADAKKKPTVRPAKGDPVDQERRAVAQRLMTHRRMTEFINYQLPAGASLDVLADQSIFIKKSIDEVISNAFWGAMIAIVILFLFLRNAWQTLIIGLTIPISVIATFGPMYMSDVSLNIISLGGLALGVGMLVDNGIVVLESIFRCREEGDDLVPAVVRGTQEVGMAVIASTLTTVAVFFPIVFVEGVAGQVFGDMALTVVFSLLASLVAALFFIPMLASRQLGSGAVMAAKALGSDYLHFDWVDKGTWWSRPLRALGLIMLRLGIALLMIIAAVLKTLIVLFLLPVSGLRAPSAWASEDSFVPLRSDRIWPGMLVFHAPAHFAASARGVWAWTRRSPRWWMKPKYLLLPVSFGFLVIRYGAETAFRLVGTLLQTVVLAMVQLLVGLFRFVVSVLGPLGGFFAHAFELGYRQLQQGYPRVIAASIRNRGTVIATAMIAFAICWGVLIPRIGKELIPQVHQGEFYLDITLPVGTPLERTGEVAGLIDAMVKAQKEVERTALNVGTEEGSTAMAQSGEHTARLTVRLKPGLAAADESALVNRVRDHFGALPETNIELSYPALFSFKNPIEIEIRGHDLATLKRLSREAEDVLSRTVPGLVDIRSTLQTGNPEIQIVYNRDRLAEYGLNLRNVADLVRNKVQGRVATEFRKEDQMIDILVRLQEQDRLGLEELRGLIVNPNGAVPIRLSAVADLTVSDGPSEIRRIDQQRTAVITANKRGDDLATISRDITAAMETINFPAGFGFMITGQNKEMQTSLTSLLMAFALALFLVYIVMASQFESLVQPLLIMMTVPLALIGVIVVLWLTAMPISIMVFLGLIILAGIVVNNAIILVDYINTLRDRGLELVAAITDAGSARLRPILMTTLTTVLGLVPMALGLGEGAEIRAPMAVTVIVGLTTSTLLTLIVIPTLYYQFAGGSGNAPAPVVASTPAPVRAEAAPLAK